MRVLIQYHSGDEIKKNEMGAECGKYGREERWIQEFWLGNQSERDHFKYLITDGGVTKVDLQEDRYRDKRRTAVETVPNSAKQ
jgi:hypothetical protein